MKKKIKFIGGTNAEKTLGILALILVVAVIGKTSIISPGLEKWFQARERFNAQKDLYNRYVSVYNKSEEVEAIYKKNIKTIEAIEKKIFTGNDINVTAAKLQKVVQQLADNNNIRVMRTNTEKPVKISGGLYVITLGVFGEARTMKDLNSFLEQLEYYQDKFLHAPRLYLKNIHKRISLEIQIFSVAMIS